MVGGAEGVVAVGMIGGFYIQGSGPEALRAVGIAALGGAGLSFLLGCPLPWGDGWSVHRVAICELFWRADPAITAWAHWAGLGGLAALGACGALALRGVGVLDPPAAGDE